jgi:hypothetical protein
MEAWPGAAMIGVANGVAREATYGKRLPELAAHQLSTVTAIAAFAMYFRALDRRWPITDDGQALAIGAAWLSMTVGFEFGFGRLVAKASWEEMLAEYDLARGRTWPLVLAWIGFGPKITRTWHAT